MTLPELIAQLRRDVSARQTARNGTAEAILVDRIRGQCMAENRAPTAAESGKIAAAVRVLAVEDAMIDVLVARVADCETELLRDQVADRLSHELVATGAGRPSYDRVGRVGYEARTYRPDQDPHGKAFLLDVSRAFIFQDPSSHERLARHASEERVERAAYFADQERAAGTGQFAGLTVPQYLTDLFAPAVAPMRPFADNCTTHHDLPAAGMTVNISRITTASSAAIQAAQNVAVSETNMADTLLTIPVQTAAGQQTLSRQAIERGTGIEDVTMNDLIKRYATVLDATLLTQAVTGLDAVSQSFPYVDATPTTPKLWPRLFAAQNGVELALLAQAFPSHHVMHPRRWNWICSQVSASWPSVGAGMFPPQLFAQTVDNEYGVGTRAVLSNGMKIVTDANIGTTLGAGTEDRIYTVAKAECHLWEDPNAPLFIRAEQPAAAALGVLLVVYGYFAYTHSRYTNAVSQIGGTGLIAPVF